MCVQSMDCTLTICRSSPSFGHPRHRLVVWTQDGEQPSPSPLFLLWAVFVIVVVVVIVLIVVRRLFIVIWLIVESSTRLRAELSFDFCGTILMPLMPLMPFMLLFMLPLLLPFNPRTNTVYSVCAQELCVRARQVIDPKTNFLWNVCTFYRLYAHSIDCIPP